MAFLNPLLLLGALGIAAPIIIHLLARKKIKRVVWAAMRFLKTVVEKNQKRLTIEDIVLLVMRCALLILLALALARPTLRQAGAGGFGGNNAAAVILLDNSASMAQSDGASSKFEQAQKAAEEVIDALPSGSLIAVWLVSDVVRNVIPEPTKDFALARKVIREARRTDRGTEMQPALRRAIEVLQRQQAETKQLFILTDGQAVGWKQLSESRALLESVKKDTRGWLVLMGEAERQNLAVTGLRLASALAPVNEPVRFEIEITNAGAEEARNVQVGLSIGAEPAADETSIDLIPAGESREVSLFATFREAGPQTVVARLPADRQPADDQRTLALRAIDAIDVLLVDGDPGIEPRESEVFYLRNALTPVAPEKREQYYLKTRTISVAELPSVKLGEFEAVVLANVPEIPENVIAGLENYLRAGGGLIIFPGGKTNAGFYNTRLFAQRAMLPAAFGEVRGDEEKPEQFFQLQSKGYDHPIVSLWRDPAAGNLAAAHFTRAFTLQPAKGDPPRAEAGLPVVVLAYVDGTPAVMERQWGYGRVVQFSSTADTAWNDLCIRPVFVPLMHRVIGALVTRQDENLNVRVGARLSTVLPGELLGKDVHIQPPGEKAVPSLRRVAVTNGVPLLEYDDTEMAGAYEARLGDDALPLLRFATQSDPAESRLEDLSAVDLKTFEGVAQVVRWSPETSLRGRLEKERAGTELWLALVLAALGVAVAETMLGNRWSASR